MDKAAIKTRIKDYSVMFVDDEQIVTEIMKNILPFLFKEVHYATNIDCRCFDFAKKAKPIINNTIVAGPGTADANCTHSYRHVPGSCLNARATQSESDSRLNCA